MKKTFLTICAMAAFFFAACTPEAKPENPDNGGDNGGDKPAAASVVLKSDAAVAVPQDGGIYTVEFTSSKDWKAAVDVDKEVAFLNVAEGTASDGKVKLTIMKYDEENKTRTITLSITAEGAEPVSVVFTQEGVFAPYFTVSESELYVGVEGGTKEFTVSTNLEFTVEAAMDEWLTYAEKDGVYTFTAAASKLYSSRYGKLVFTVPDIQDPVYDDEGNDTGETQDHVQKVYLIQDGNATVTWSKELSSDYAESANLSIAVTGGYMFVCNGATVACYSAADGSYVMPIDLGIAVSSITTDDAGNILIATGGGYVDAEAPFMVYVLPVTALTDATKVKIQVAYVNEFYGYGLNNVRATGDCYAGEGIITATSAGGGDWNEGIIGDSFVLAWQIKDGAAVALDGTPSLNAEAGSIPYTDYVTVPTTDIMWNSCSFVAMGVGTKMSEGIYEIGYDGIYALRYNNTWSRNDWSTVLESGSSWAEGYNCIDITTWNGHKVCAFIGMAYFPYWGMPSYLWLVNIDNATAPELIYCGEYYGEGLQYSESADVALVVNGDSLDAYVIDGEQGVMGLYHFPKL